MHAWYSATAQHNTGISQLHLEGVTKVVLVFGLLVFGLWSFFVMDFFYPPWI